MTQELNYIANDERFKTAIISGEEYPNYLVSNYGRVYSLSTRRFMRGYTDRYGYRQHYLYKDGVRTHAREHRLVAWAFIDNPHGYEILNHKDSCKSNNYYQNIEWCSYKYNATHGIKQALKIARMLKPVIQLDKNKKVIARYRSIKEASEKGNIAPSMIYDSNRYGKLRKQCYWKYKEVS